MFEYHFFYYSRSFNLWASSPLDRCKLLEEWKIFCKYKLTFSHFSVIFSSDFEVLSFPCNQFGSQMPQKDGDDMMANLEKREANVGVVMKKIMVNGANTAPLYKFLKEKQGSGDRIKWNFVKFLVNKKGEVIERYGSSIAPNTLAPKIDELLKEKK